MEKIIRWCHIDMYEVRAVSEKISMNVLLEQMSMLNVIIVTRLESDN